MEEVGGIDVPGDDVLSVMLELSDAVVELGDEVAVSSPLLAPVKIVRLKDGRPGNVEVRDGSGSGVGVGNGNEDEA